MHTPSSPPAERGTANCDAPGAGGVSKGVGGEGQSVQEARGGGGLISVRSKGRRGGALIATMNAYFFTTANGDTANCNAPGARVVRARSKGVGGVGSV